MSRIHFTDGREDPWRETWASWENQDQIITLLWQPEGTLAIWTGGQYKAKECQSGSAYDTRGEWKINLVTFYIILCCEEHV